MAWITLNDCLSTVAVSKGGTGLTSAPMLATNLASTSAESIFQSAPRPGVVGTLPVDNGGTGQTSLMNARRSFHTFTQLWTGSQKSNAAISITNIQNYSILAVKCDMNGTSSGIEAKIPVVICCRLGNTFYGSTAMQPNATSYKRIWFFTLRFDVSTDTLTPTCRQIGAYGTANSGGLGTAIHAFAGDSATFQEIWGI